MKQIIGLLTIIFTLTGATLAILALWDIYPISWEIIWKSCLSMAITCVTILLVYLLYTLFMKKHKFNINKDGGKAHPIN